LYDFLAFFACLASKNEQGKGINLKTDMSPSNYVDHHCPSRLEYMKQFTADRQKPVNIVPRFDAAIIIPTGNVKIT